MNLKPFEIVCVSLNKAFFFCVTLIQLPTHITTKLKLCFQNFPERHDTNCPIR